MRSAVSQQHPTGGCVCGPNRVSGKLAWKWMRNGDRHLGLFCGRCDCYIQWVPQTVVWLALAPPIPEPEFAAPAPRNACNGRCLLGHVLAPANLEEALHKIRQRKAGRHPAAGVDGVRPHELRGNALPPEVVEALWACTYEPLPNLAIELPKDGAPGGETRTIEISSALDRRITRAVYQVLSPLIDSRLSPYCFGFRPGRGQRDAVEHLGAHIRSTRLQWCLALDVQQAFDSLRHDLVLKRLGRYVTCTHVLALVRAYLRCSAVSRSDWFQRYARGRERPPRRTVGVPQGNSLSPLLCNLVLDDLDRYLLQRKRVFARYGDDVRILTRSRETAGRLFVNLKTFLTTMGLQPHKAKSAVRPVHQTAFLGYAFGEEGDVQISDNAVQKGIALAKNRILQEPDVKDGVLYKEDVDWFLQGWDSYYRKTSNFREARRGMELALMDWKNGPRPKTRT